MMPFRICVVSGTRQGKSGCHRSQRGSRDISSNDAVRFASSCSNRCASDAPVTRNAFHDLHPRGVRAAGPCERANSRGFQTNTRTPARAPRASPRRRDVVLRRWRGAPTRPPLIPLRRALSLSALPNHARWRSPASLSRCARRGAHSVRACAAGFGGPRPLQRLASLHSLLSCCPLTRGTGGPPGDIRDGHGRLVGGPVRLPRTQLTRLARARSLTPWRSRRDKKPSAGAKEAAQKALHDTTRSPDPLRANGACVCPSRLRYAPPRASALAFSVRSLVFTCTLLSRICSSQRPIAVVLPTSRPHDD